ncbi:MAG: hypothetical protein V1495_04075 [Pseudomonadota bacterium]
MRDIPGVAWILGGFVLFAIILFIYSKTGPVLLPPAESAWSQVEEIRAKLTTRKITLRVSEARDETAPPYRLELRRLKDLEGSPGAARYLLELRPMSFHLLKDSWLGSGVEVAFLDLQPTEMFGIIRLVSLRKVDTKLY